jgi:3'-phosphoadenosine 5'-phosphosulfate sulfotransferase (PAPS reductase)/FAD synthetase
MVADSHELADKYESIHFVYCDTLAYEHPDNLRFLREIEEWIDRPIEIISSKKYTDIFDVFDKTGWLVGPGGARCTTELKKVPRQEYSRPDDTHCFGLTSDEGKRIDLFEKNNPELSMDWILRDSNMTKHSCYKLLKDNGIELPAMYKLGFRNNNCRCCVKASSFGYWNRVRRLWPDIFDKMARQERKMDVAICKSYAGDKKRKRVFLDEIDPNAQGRFEDEEDIECGLVCGLPLLKWADAENEEKARAK